MGEMQVVNRGAHMVTHGLLQQKCLPVGSIQISYSASFVKKTNH